MPSADLQPILDELTVMRGLIELLSPLPPDTRACVLTWLQSVTATATIPAPAPTPTPPALGAPGQASARAALSARIAQLSQREGPEVSEASKGDEAEKPP